MVTLGGIVLLGLSILLFSPSTAVELLGLLKINSKNLRMKNRCLEVLFILMQRNFTHIKRQIDGVNPARPKSIIQRKARGFNAEYKGFGFNGETETNISEEFENDISFDYDHFELDLNPLEGEDYFDCVLNDYDLTTTPSMKLMRICNVFEILEAFDAVNLIDRFMPMLMEQIETNSADEQEALHNFFWQSIS